jgi:arylsulfatase A-like enzyme
MKRVANICLALLAISCVSRLAAADTKPNIIFIVSDDQRPDTIRALGNPVIQTPQLDRLAARGSVFPRAIAAYPICYASRAEILTGCCAFRAFPRYPTGAIDPQLATLAGTFQQAGYTTCYTGKWHNDGHPRQRGYTCTSGLFSSGGAQGAKGTAVDTQGRPVTGYVGWTFKTDDGRVELEKGVGLTPRTSEHIADGAIAFLQQKPARPFLLHVNFAAPHDPRMMPPGYQGRYDPKTIPLPENFAPQHPFDHGNIAGRDEKLLAKPLDPDDVRRELACYYAVISHMDQQVGRICDALEAAGRKEDTLIIFTTDQGLALGSHGLLGKQNMYEHTVGVPLIIAGPGVPGGRRFSAQCYLRDLFPTCCELAGLPIPKSVQGKSLLPVLRGQADRIHDFVIAYFMGTQRMIRDERWKLVVYPQAGRQQLFDLQTDPHELHDLSADASHTERLAGLRAKLKSWLGNQGDGVLK